MRARFAFGFGLAACTFAGAAGATSPHPSARLELTHAPGAERCIDAKRLVRAVEARLSRRVFETDKAPLLLRVELRHEGDAFVAELELADELGELGRRELSSRARHCSALDDSLALVVALLVDTPPARAPEPAKAPASPKHAEKPVEAKPPEPVRATPLELPRDTLAPREPWLFQLRLSGIVAWGLLPSTSFAPEFAVAARPPRGLLWRGSFEYFFSQEARVSSDAGAHFSRQRVGLELCWPDLFGARVSGSICLGQRLGRLAASGFGFDHNLEERVFTFAISGAFDVRFPVGRYFAVTVGGRAELPLSRHRFSARLSDGSNRDVFSEPPVGGMLRAGFETDL